jgi:hypothetical protein
VNLRTFGGATRARLERRFHRESGRLHWVAAAVGLRSAALIGRRERGGVYVVLGKIPASDDSCQRALLSCFAAFADAGVLVHLLLLDYARDADYTINGLRDRSLLPAAVTVRYFWRDAAPSGDGGAITRPLVGLPQPATAARMPGRSHRTIYSQDGLPLISVTAKDHGAEVEHFGSTGAATQRDEYDERGRLVRTLDLIEATGDVATHRYRDADGTCWLSAWVNQSNGASGPLQMHRPSLREFATYSDVHAAWVTAKLQRSIAPLIIAADNQSARVVAKSRHPTAYRVTLKVDGTVPADPRSLLEFYSHVTSPTARRRRPSAVQPPAPLIDAR